MSGFVASPPAAPTPDGNAVAWDSFWPAIDINLFRDAMRIGGQAIPDARVQEALLGASIVAADNLAAWQHDQVEAGYATLEAVPGGGIRAGAATAEPVSRLVILWRRAVHAFAAADLIETHRDVTATAKGERDAERVDMTPDDHRRNAVRAIRAMLGTPGVTVELI